ncbi:MAG: 50S ribosomal protein L31e [Candidatus Aenigmatarchaeota archaeon]|nr:50S ribosomal protein L31e [Nanoarchaeota archaeon]
MAKKATERVYTIPLRSEWMKVPRNRRAKRAKSAIEGFLIKHFHASDVKISQMVNESLWIRGIEKPPAKIRVKASIDDKGVVMARLPEEAVLKEALEKKDKKAKEKDVDMKIEEKTSAGEKVLEEKDNTSEVKPVEEKAEEKTKAEEKPKEEKPAEKKVEEK